MKKLIMVSILVFTSSFLFSQSFTITPEGLKDELNLNNTYLVIDKENTSAEDLYNATIRYINEQMKNPESSIKSDIKGDYIRYSVYVPELIRYSNSGSKRKIQGYFDIEFRFKNNRVRYEILNLKMPDKDSKYEVVFSGSKWSCYPIFENNGKLFKKKEKDSLELFFNTLVANYKNYIIEGSSKDDW